MRKNKPREKREKPVKKKREGYTGRRKQKLKDYAISKGRQTCKNKRSKNSLPEPKKESVNLKDLKMLMRKRFGKVTLEQDSD